MAQQLGEKLVTSVGGFDLSIEWIKSVFKVDNILSGHSMQEYKKFGGTKAFYSKLQSSLKGGIEDSASGKAKRVEYFGTNALVEPPQKTLWEIFIGTFDDLTLKMLLAAAAASLIIGIATEGWSHGWYESVAIMVAVAIVVTITTVTDYTQAQQFRNLFKKSEVKIVKVVRDGKLSELNTQDLVVGDVFEATTGLIMPADCLLIEKHADFLVDESQMTGESHLIKKTPDDHPAEDATPFLISGSKIQDGSGFAMVLSVGLHSQLGILRSSMESEPEDTPLQLKLTDLAEMIGNIGMFGAGLTFIGCTLGLMLTIFWDENRKLIELRTLNDIMGFVILAITIIVMAVPEGLPMAVVISLAFSVEKMRQMNNLVRDMSACETMGNVTDVCSDKTGTLTENNMTVIDIYYSGNLVSVGNSNTVDKLKKDPDLVDLCCAAVINNSATPDFSKSLKEQLGNKTDMAICEFGFKIGVDYNKVRQIDRVLKMIPFSSDRKKMMTLYQREDGSKFLYVKGAPEAILKECAFYKQDGKSFRIENSWRTNLDENIIRLIADKKARAIGVSKIEVDTYKDGDDISKLENEMTFLGIFGIMDPVRAEVPEAVKTSQGAGITVRMVTGDNVQIGAAIAKECGILPKGWQPSSDDNSVMDGKTFREKVGDLKWKEEMRDDKKVRIPFVGDMYAFTKIEPELRVIGRCLPTDKLLLVTGLQALGKVVAVTGDGANDAPALKKADVGLGMGKTGTDICKDASKIVLLDDKFSTIVTAVKFGRNIFDAIRKFIKFQLTVNLTAMAIAVFCGFVIKQSPINAIQMLWVNVIMDSFSSLALATEPPTDELLLRPPTKKREHIITQTMWNAICFQAVCQFVLLLLVLFLSPGWFGIPSTIGVEGYEAEAFVHYTFFFDVFVFLQMFNFINARVLKKEEKNPFQNICSNPIFWIIVLLTLVGQICFVQLIGRPVKCTPLSLEMHLIALGLGLFSLVFAFLEKCIPDKYLPFPLLFKEKDEVTEENVTHGVMSFTGRGPYKKTKSSIIKN